MKIFFTQENYEGFRHLVRRLKKYYELPPVKQEEWTDQYKKIKEQIKEMMNYYLVYVITDGENQLTTPVLWALLNKTYSDGFLEALKKADLDAMDHWTGEMQKEYKYWDV